MGEPLLHPDLATFLALARDRSLRVNLTTNGVLLADRAEVLLSAPALRQVNVSLASFEANAAGLSPAAFDESLAVYLDGVIAFARAAAETPLLVSFRLWNDGPAGANAANPRVLAALEREFLPGAPAGSLADRLRASPRLTLRDRAYLNLAPKFDWPDPAAGAGDDDLFCMALRDQFGVLSDGTVVPCCLDGEGRIPLGNAFRAPLEDALESPRARALRDGFSRRRAVEKLCRSCGYARAAWGRKD